MRMNRSDPDGLFRLDSRHVINFSIAVLSALVVALAVRTGWHSLLNFKQAKTVQLAYAAASDFVAVAGDRELERTYGSALLGGIRGEPSLRAKVALVRSQGDQAWQRAMRRARLVALYSRGQTELLERLAQAESSDAALHATRVRLDACAGGGDCRLDAASWQHVVSKALDDLDAAREAVLLNLDAQGQPIRFYAALCGPAWVVAEYVRRQRSIMAFYLSARTPLPQAVPMELAAERGVTDRAIEELREYRQLRDVDIRIRVAIDAVDHSVTTDFEPLTAAVLSGGLQLDGPGWLARTQPSVVAIAGLSGAIDSVLSQLAARAMRASRNDMYFNGLLILLACAVAALGTTKVRQAANALFQQKELAEVTIRSIGDAVITTDASGRVEYVNPAAEQMTGWRDSEAKGLPVAQVFNVVNGFTLEPQASPIEACLRENRVVSLDNNTVLIRRDGARLYIEDSAAPIRNRAGQLIGGVLVFYDAAEVHQAGHLIAYRASHDPLSGLINRREFEHRLAALLAPGRDDASQHALLYLDLDQFKVVNDTCGHLAGDQLLREVSQLLNERKRENDVLARLGGDEFGLIVHRCSLQQACAIGEQLRAAISEHRFEWQGLQFNPHISIGLVPFSLDAGPPVALMSHADAACHLAKERGRDRLQVYDVSDREIARHFGAMHWVARLTEALDADRFVLYCQPVVASNGRRAVPRAEVLVRMLDSDGTLCLPSQFIPPAERYGLMSRLDRWIVRRALAAVAEANGRGWGDRIGVLSINLSGATLSDPLAARFLREEISRSGVAPHALCFEITETAAVSSLVETSALINLLRQIGCTFALDDFGRGMSSFMYLKELRVDYLKIDGEFVRNMVDDPVSRAMVQAIHALGQAMNIATIAEWVETPTLRHLIETLGIDYMQGYELGKPEPLAVYLERHGRAMSA
jgi:diguanylate cyclase (GGDEF)-like protein/PAS domain S-box-containing protein